MKKSNLTGLIVAGVAVAVQSDSSVALAGTTTYTNLTTQSSASFTIPISPVLDADELIAINEGTASGGEFSVFTLTVDYANSTQDIIDQLNSGPSGFSLNLNTITDKTFPLGNINGLTFTVAQGTGTKNVTVPAGTIFTFDTVPEPSMMALSALGSAGVWLAARRREQG
jgi:hypothetical protein